MESAITEYLHKAHSGDVEQIVFLLACVLTVLVISLAAIWAKHKRAENLMLLKADMLSRGMSADDIERVLSAGSKVSKTACCESTART